MSLRWEYEALRISEDARLSIKAACIGVAPQVRPCIFDKKSGARLQLTEDEQGALKPLIARMSNGSTPFESPLASTSWQTHSTIAAWVTASNGTAWPIVVG